MLSLQNIPAPSMLVSRDPLEAQLNNFFLTIRDVERQLKLGKSTIYKLIQTGVFPPGLKVGGARRWTNDCIQNFIKERSEHA